MKPPASRRRLDRWLDERNEHPERLPQVDARIRARFEERRAVFVLDMCGFSRLSLRHGIIHFLAMIRRLHALALPIIEGAGGRVVKTEADNVFAVFARVPPALAAADELHAALARANRVLPEDWDLHVGIGIGYGDLLLIGDEDLFGEEMNLASKLGEDLAEAGDVLLTDAAWADAGRARRRFVRRTTRLGGRPLTYHARKGR